MVLGKKHRLLLNLHHHHPKPFDFLFLAFEKCSTEIRTVGYYVRISASQPLHVFWSKGFFFCHMSEMLEFLTHF